jgi:plastocyanin
MPNHHWLRIGAALLSCAVVAGALDATAATPEEERKAICEEAAARYQDLHGRAMADEPVQIIAMYKYTFCPPKLDVRQGSKVRFINLDKRTSHSFWFRDAGRPESERYFGGEGSEMVMDLPAGTHTYLCGPHYEREGMIGEITIVP